MTLKSIFIADASLHENAVPELRTKQSLDEALRIHLIAFLGASMVDRMLPIAKEVIGRANKNDWDTPILLPASIKLHGLSSLPVISLLTHLRLEPFIQLEGDLVH